jgi:phosphoribosylanthranilate isomerase
LIVKVCGLKRAEDLKVAKECGADVLGMICGVPESPRNNSVEDCIKLLNSIDGVKKAVLFRNSPVVEVIEAASQFNCDILHFCGNEDTAYRELIQSKFPKMTIWQSFGVPLENPNDPDWFQKVNEALIDKTIGKIVLDSQKSGKTGGAGVAFPFDIVAKRLAQNQNKIIIAGGLKVGLLKDLFSHLCPLGLDISSGVEESPGVKSREKIVTFFEELSSYQ